MSLKPPGRIPFEEIANAKSWMLPQVNGQSINGEEQTKRKAKASKKKSEQQKRTEPELPVVSEDVAVAAEKQQATITAQELEAITQAAELDGHEKGYAEGLEQGRQDGRKAGYSDGLKAGTEQANSEHGQWLREQGDNLHKLCSSLISPLSHQQQELADTTLDLAMGLARHILDEELKIEPQKIITIVDKAISALPPVEKGIELYFHPDDMSAYKTYGPTGISHDAIHADETLERGSCRVHSEHSFVDYSVASRLQQFAEELTQKPFDEEAAAEPIPAVVRDHILKRDGDAEPGIDRKNDINEKPNSKDIDSEDINNAQSSDGDGDGDGDGDSDSTPSLKADSTEQSAGQNLENESIETDPETADLEAAPENLKTKKLENETTGHLKTPASPTAPTAEENITHDGD